MKWNPSYNMSDTDIHPSQPHDAASIPLNLRQRGDNTTNVLQLEVQEQKAGLIQDSKAEVVYNHIVRVFLNDGAALDGPINSLLRSVRCTDLHRLRRLIRQPWYNDWLLSKKHLLNEEQYRDLSLLESFLNNMHNNTGPVSSGYVDITTRTRDDYVDMMLEYYEPITYDEDLANRWATIHKRDFATMYKMPVLKIRDLYGIDYYGDDDLWYDLYGTGYYGDSRDPTPPNIPPLYTILRGNSTNDTSNVDSEDVVEDMKEHTSTVTTITAPTYASANNNDSNNSTVSRDVSNDGRVHDKNEVSSGHGSISSNITATSDTNYAKHGTNIIATDTGSETIDDTDDGFVVSNTSNVPLLSNSAVGNTYNNGFDITSREHTAVESIMNRTGDEELVYLYVLKRKEDKRIRSSIAKHITGSSKNYSRAVSICKPSVITIQKFVRRFILKNSITSHAVHHGSCSSILNTLDPLEIMTMNDGSNHSTPVITQSIHLSPCTTTDVSTANPTQGTEPTTCGMSNESHEIGTYTDVRPWGELLCHMVPSKTPSSNQYVDALVDTFPKKCEYHEDVGTYMYVTLSNKKIGECVYAFLIKDWQWIDTEIKKYAHRALIWYIESPVGNLPSRYAKNHLMCIVRDVDLLLFFLGDCLCLECSTDDSGVVHIEFTSQGRWGEVPSTSCEEKWGARDHRIDHESLILSYECLSLRVNFDLTSRELQVLILDILSHLSTWIFNCPATFTECEFDLQNLCTCGDIFRIQNPRSLAV